MHYYCLHTKLPTSRENVKSLGEKLVSLESIAESPTRVLADKNKYGWVMKDIICEDIL